SNAGGTISTRLRVAYDNEPATAAADRLECSSARQMAERRYSASPARGQIAARRIAGVDGPQHCRNGRRSTIALHDRRCIAAAAADTLQHHSRRAVGSGCDLACVLLQDVTAEHTVHGVTAQLHYAGEDDAAIGFGSWGICHRGKVEERLHIATTTVHRLAEDCLTAGARDEYVASAVDLDGSRRSVGTLTSSK